MKNVLADRKKKFISRELGGLCFLLYALALCISPCLAETTEKAPALAENEVAVQGSPVQKTAPAPGASQYPGSQMNAYDPFSNFVSPYADHKAQRVGDIITIIITESSRASKSSATKTSKKSGSKSSLSDFFGLGDAGLPMKMGVDAGSDYSGSGTTTRSGTMEAKVSASVKQVLPNGNLMLAGNRQVTVNDDVQTITISGIVRPQDIMADNSVLSMYLADARIQYAGEGPIAQKPGIVTRILQTPFHWVAGAFRKIF